MRVSIQMCGMLQLRQVAHYRDSSRSNELHAEKNITIANLTLLEKKIVRQNVVKERESNWSYWYFFTLVWKLWVWMCCANDSV